jgi:glutamate formiminotransferase
VQNLDIDEAEHDDKDHRSNGEEDNVPFTPVKNVFKHDLDPCNELSLKVVSRED